MPGSNAGRRTIAAADAGPNIRRNHRPHVAREFAVTLAEPQIQVPLRPVRRLPADHIALGGENSNRSSLASNSVMTRFPERPPNR